MNKRIYLIHGWTGTPNNDWLPWIKEQLEKRSIDVIVPVMPDTDHPTMESWVGHLSNIVKKPDINCYFVGHSLGCITILRFLETLSDSEKVGGTLLVAGFGQDLNYEGYNHELGNFFKKPILCKKIQKHCRQFISIHSDNDPFVSLDQNLLFQKKLNAEIHIEHNMSHYHQEAGIVKAPFVLTCLLRMIEKRV